jgi:hypothetical protein
MFDTVWATIIAGLFGTLVGAMATVFAALINRKPSLAVVIDARIRVLIETYEKTIAELRGEIASLRARSIFMREPFGSFATI